ncbi:MAG: hypothetical protein ACFFFC_00545 [Candidatus Thorarchaeota archaeon]
MAKDIKPTRFPWEGERKSGLDAVKNRGRPIGGASEVSIPPLDADPIEGQGPMTMQEQAQALRDPTNPISPNYSPQERLNSAGGAQMNPHALRTAQQRAVSAAGQTVGARKGSQGPFGGFVPPESYGDPNFRPGVGSAYAVNQPSLRQKDQSGLSEETINGLEALRDFNNRANEEQSKQLKKEEKRFEEEAKKFDDEFGAFSSPNFLNAYKQEVNELADSELKQAIEARLKPLDLEQLILYGEARQDVPIVPNVFIPTFRTVTGEENLEIERRLFGSDEPDIYIFDKLALMQLTAGLYAINNNVLPDHLDKKRLFSIDLFTEKFRKVVKLPLAMLASLGINFTWFDQRTRRLFIDKTPLKNG